MTDLRELLAKVEGAAEGSQELDEAIHATLLPDDPWWACIVEGRRLVAAGDDLTYVVHPTSGSRMRAASWALSSRVKSYTSSMDAALSLVNKLLPEWGYNIIQGIYEVPRVWLVAPDEGGHGDCGAATMPLAIIGSLLLTLIAQPQSDGGRIGEG